MTISRIEKVKDLVARDKIEMALDELLSISKTTSDKKIQNLIILNCSNYKKYYHDNLLNIGNDNSSRNKAILSILEFLDDLEIQITQNIKQIGKSQNNNFPIKDTVNKKKEVLLHQKINTNLSYFDFNLFSKYILDLLDTFQNGIAGVKSEIDDNAKADAWATNLIGMLFDTFKDRQSDIQIIWLKPDKNNIDTLKHYKSKNIKHDYDHYQFNKGEGLAGKVWQSGISVYTSELKKHYWWVYREGCENVSYICAIVGNQGGNGGVISVGSNLGFTVTDVDLEVVKIFGALLNLSLINNKIST